MSMEDFINIEFTKKDPNWHLFVRKSLTIADRVEFNVLFKRPGLELEKMLKEYNGIITTPKPNSRFYFNKNMRVSFPIDGGINQLLLNYSFEYWINKVVEDPSFILSSKEILGTISHEMMCRFSKKHYEEISENFLSH